MRGNEGKRVRVVGHRGAKSVWPENSRQGFRATAVLGVDAVEFDIHPTRDGDLAVIHDPTLDRTTLAQGPVAALCSAALSRVALRDTSEVGVPMLGEVLEILRPSRVELHIELKADASGVPYEGLEAKAIAAVEAAGLMDSAVFTSFVPEVLERLRALQPACRLLASLNERSATALGGPAAAVARFRAVPIDYLAVERNLLSRIHPLCLDAFPAERLGAWVLNEPAEIAHWLGQPIGLITSDRPDLVLAAREAG